VVKGSRYIGTLSLSCLDTGQSACFEPAMCVSNKRKSRTREPNANQVFMAKRTTTTEHGSAKVATEGDVNASPSRPTGTPLFFRPYAHGIFVFYNIKKLSWQCIQNVAAFIQSCSLTNIFKPKNL
jgi:hypothetical protein